MSRVVRMPAGGRSAERGGVNLNYDMRHGFQPPGRPQEEGAWTEAVRRERRIREKQSKSTRPLRPGTPGATKVWTVESDSTMPFHQDDEAWRRELLRRDPNEGARYHGTQHRKPVFARMPTEEIREVQRRAGEELERRQWRAAMKDFNTQELANLSEILGEKIAQRQEAAYLQQNRIQPLPPPGVRPPWAEDE